MHFPAAAMIFAHQNVLTMLVIGAVAGWLASRFIQNHGLGIAGDVIAGAIGAYVGTWVLTRLGLRFGTGLVRQAANAAIGSAGCLGLVRFIRWI
jgi:uncharacterized membrane protein YeaQ/YmgE (transglycosylase-associated protein family)